MPDDEQKRDETEGHTAAGDPPPDEPPKQEATPAAEDESEDAAGAPSDEDRFRPEAIAARVDKLGEEDELDRIARQEEKKLLERKKGTKGKKGLQASASKRLAKIGEGKVKRPSAIADAVAPEADPLLERAARLREWIKGNRQTFGAIVAVALLGVGGALGYTYWQNKHDAEASALLAQGWADEHGHVSDKDDDEDDDKKARELYPTFKSAAERRDSAMAKYRQVEQKYAGTGAAILARLGEGGLLLDAGDAKGAIAAYEDVKSSPLAQADTQVRGRALEGIGFAHELLATKDEAGKDKHLDDALAAFKQLEQVDQKEFKELGLYHQARVFQAKGDKAKAVEMLKDVYKRVSDPGESHPFAYLDAVVEDRLRALDPSALPAKAPKASGPGGGALDMNDPQIQQLLKQLQQQAQQNGGGAPPAPPPAPPK